MTYQWLENGDAAWDGTLQALAHDVYHLAGWNAIEADLLGGTSRAFLYREGSDVLFVPLILRPIPGTQLVDATSAFGYPGPVANTNSPDVLQRALGSLIGALGEMGTVSAFARLHPLLGIPCASLEDWGRVVQHGETVAIDLLQTEEEIWRWVKRDHRQDINRARRGGLEARVDEDWNLLDTFIEIYQATMRRVDASAVYHFPREYFLELHERLADRVQLWVVEADGEVASAGLFTNVDGVVQFHLSGTSDSHLRLSPSKLMIDQVWRSAKRAGMRIFHLGGGVGARHDPLFTFKSRFSNWHMPFHTWRSIVDPAQYRALAEERAPDGEADGYFPAYRRRDDATETPGS